MLGLGGWSPPLEFLFFFILFFLGLLVSPRLCDIITFFNLVQKIASATGSTPSWIVFSFSLSLAFQSSTVVADQGDQSGHLAIVMFVVYIFAERILPCQQNLFFCFCCKNSDFAMSANLLFCFCCFKIKNCAPAISLERFNVYLSINLANVKSGQERVIKVAILLLLHWYTSIIVILLSKYNLHFCFELLET